MASRKGYESDKPFIPEFSYFPDSKIIDPASISELKCLSCYRILPTHCFNTNVQAKYGYHNSCRNCLSYYRLHNYYNHRVKRGKMSQEEVPHFITFPLTLNNESLLKTLYVFRAHRDHAPMFATNLNDRSQVFQVALTTFRKGVKFGLTKLDPSIPCTQQIVKYNKKRNAPDFEGLLMYGNTRSNMELFSKTVLNYLRSKDLRLHVGDDCQV